MADLQSYYYEHLSCKCGRIIEHNFLFSVYNIFLGYVIIRKLQYNTQYLNLFWMFDGNRNHHTGDFAEYTDIFFRKVTYSRYDIPWNMI